jgi:uncharacterized membrane-anchored protein YhcB (DUF1043 family)
MGFILGMIAGVVVGGLLVMVFGKNNKKHIEAVRSEVVGAYNKGAGEVEKLINSWKK